MVRLGNLSSLVLPTLLASGSACVDPSMAGSSIKDASQEVRAPVVVTVGPHLRGGVPTRRVDTAVCGGTTVELHVSYTSGPRGGLQSQVTRVVIDGAAVDAAALAPVNRALRTFATPPQISSLCLGRRISLSLSDLTASRPTRREMIHLTIE